jgi:acyl carrier protein
MNTCDELIHLLSTDFNVDPATIAVDRQLAEYGIDSLGLVDLMFTVEEHFGIDLPADMAQFRTLGDFAALVDRLRMPVAA